MIEIKYGDDLCEVTSDMVDGVYLFEKDYINSHTEDEIEWECAGLHTTRQMISERIEDGLYDEWEGF